MSWMPIVIIQLAVFVLGFAAAHFLNLVKARTTRDIANELFRESEAQRRANVDAILEHVKTTFGSLSLDALSKSTGEFLKLAKEKLESERAVNVRELEAKKSLIDQQLQHMAIELQNVSTLMETLEKDRIERFGELASQLKSVGEQTAALTKTTNTLREALASTKVRGQWGERMAEDILRVAGFVENVNYLKQKTIDGIGTRPDFTFLLPRNLRLNMDVKFPLDNYLRLAHAASELEEAQLRSTFLKDVKAKIKEVTTREYINPEQNTVDYVLLFIPNERVYAFIHEQDGAILEDALKSKVVFCSPITLFAILSVIRQAVDNFALEQTSNEILSLFGAFKRHWVEFVKKLDVLGRRIEDVQREYDALWATRRRQLERPLDRIEDLRTQRGLPIAPVADDEIVPGADAPADGAGTYELPPG